MNPFAQQRQTLRTWLLATVLLGIVLYLTLHPGTAAAAAIILLPLVLLGLVPIGKPFFTGKSPAIWHAPALPIRFQRPPPPLYR